MMYMGTEEAKILSCNLKEIFSNPILKGGLVSVKVEDYSEEELQKMLA